MIVLVTAQATVSAFTGSFVYCLYCDVYLWPCSSATFYPVDCFSIIEIKGFDTLFSLSGSTVPPQVPQQLGCCCSQVCARAHAITCLMGCTRERVLQCDTFSSVSPGAMGAKGAAALVCSSRSLLLTPISLERLMLLQVLICTHCSVVKRRQTFS